MERQSYQNRVRIKTGEGERWITVPVIQRSRSERIIDKRIDNSRRGRFRWSRKMFLTLRYSYQSAPHYRAYEPVLAEIFESRWDRLSDLNGRLTEFCRGALGIRTPMRNSSRMNIKGAKSDMVLNMCREAGADVYLAGGGASREYLDVPAFERAGIRVVWQEFEHPRYPQYPASAIFIPNLSALDLIFNCGPRSREILRGARAPRTAGAEVA
ncbi:MAG: WbqC family protein, partial [Elusimicrobia bacterium]|nr:WbqC family protein [Elusimicrobiota bacterium]